VELRRVGVTRSASDRRRTPRAASSGARSGPIADLYDDPNTSKFLFFTVTRAGPPNASVVVGNYAVDPHTGDVFSATLGCDEEKSKNLRALQTRIRAILRLSRSKYQRLKTKGPLCEQRPR
jgi:hypothetical protein